MALATGYISYFQWDEEPYKSDETEEVKDKYGKKVEYPNIIISIAMQVCPDCDYAEWLSIEESNYEIQDINNHTVIKEEIN